MLHLHNLNHVQIGFGGGLVNGKNGIDNIGGQALGQASAELGREGCAGDGEEELAVYFFGDLELIEELRKSENVSTMEAAWDTNLQSLILGNFKAVCDDTGVKTLRDVTVGLLEELAY